MASQANMPVSLPDPTNQAASMQPPPSGTGLCLSGGGYRAMLFHVGTLWRLYEANRLHGIDRISSVSGGSIASAALALAWSKLSFDPRALGSDFVPLLVEPIRRLAGRTIDAPSIAAGLFLPGPGSISSRVEAAYRKHLYGNSTLQDLPDTPRFVINATNVQSGALWRFSKPYMGDYRVGRVMAPKVALASAVAASSAFPPLLSPAVLDLDPASFAPGSGDDLQKSPFTSKVVLSDGGVYDNMGLETVWKSHTTVLVSDGGAKMAPEGAPHRDWVRHVYRILSIIDNQVRSLRKRETIAGFLQPQGSPGHRDGAYWGIATDIADYGLPDPLPCPHARTLQLASVATRLKALDDGTQERLINWGYAVCDAALRRHIDPTLSRPSDFPYPAARV